MMREEDGGDDGEVVVVVPERAVHIDELYPGAKSMDGSDTLTYRFEIIAACVMGLSTISGGVLEGYTSPAIPTLLQENSFNLTDVSLSTNISMINNTVDPSFNSDIEVDTYNNSFLLNQNGSVSDLRVVMSEGPEIKKLPTDLYLTKEEASWLGSLLLLGACIGALVSSWVISLGRRRAVLASAFPRLVGWIMIAAASDVYMMYGGRFLTGVSLGIVTSAAPVYISEVAHSSIRGALSCVVQLGVNLGIFTIVLLGTFVEWRGLAVFGAVTVVLYFVATLFIPDSPVWLVSTGREEDARATLLRLRGRQYCVEYDLQQIISSKASQYNAYSWKDIITQRACVLPLATVALVTVVNRCSGYNAIITYCATFLHQAVPSVSEYWAAAAVTLMQVVSTVGAVVFVDRLGRRKLLIASSATMAVALAVIAVCEVATKHGAGGSWVAVLAAILYVSAYSLGVGPVTWVLVGEMFPQAARDKAAAIISVLNWFLAFVITKTYFRLESLTGIAGTCTIYSSVCIIGLILMYLLVPETKGRTLGEIEAYFTYTHRSFKSVKNKRDVALSSILEQEGGMSETYSTFQSSE